MTDRDKADIINVLKKMYTDKINEIHEKMFTDMNFLLDSRAILVGTSREDLVKLSDIKWRVCLDLEANTNGLVKNEET